MENDNDDTLFDELHALHADELVDLGKRRSALSERWELSFPVLMVRMFKEYMLFLWKTWSKAAWSFLFFPTSTSVNCICSILPPSSQRFDTGGQSARFNLV